MADPKPSPKVEVVSEPTITTGKVKELRNPATSSVLADVGGHAIKVICPAGKLPKVGDSVSVKVVRDSTGKAVKGYLQLS